MLTDYYIVAVSENGDVLATRADHVQTSGFVMTFRLPDQSDAAYGVENQGDDNLSKSEAARDALAAVMPENDN